MARNEIFIAVPPKRVFELLSDPRTYSQWVAGTRQSRAADGDWPQPNATFDHTVGTAMVAIEDHTRVSAVLAPVMLELQAYARPLPPARVTFHLQPEGNGTRLVLIEEPASRAISIAIGPLGHLLLRIRNARTLRRLKDLAEGIAPPTEASAPPARSRGRRTVPES